MIASISYYANTIHNALGLINSELLVLTYSELLVPCGCTLRNIVISYVKKRALPTLNKYLRVVLTK